MNSMLKQATEGHGRLDRWNHFSSLKAHLSVTGAIWHLKGQPDVSRDVRIELPLHDERLNYRQVDGIMVPTKRRVVGFDDNKRKIPDLVLVAIDIHDIAFDSNENLADRN